MRPLLSVENLSIGFGKGDAVVRDVSFDVNPGETLAIVGESGSGKTVTCRAVLRILPRTAQIRTGSVTLNTDDGVYDLTKLSERQLRDVRGNQVSMIFQEPMASFAPAITVGAQMVEQLLIHTDMKPAAAKAHAIDMLARVGIPAPDKRFDQFAFEFSGGMRQRAMIAMALSTSPKLLIADEPTTALDVTIQAQVIDLMKDLVAEFGMGILFITHDLGVIAQTADKVAVMYLGRIVETGAVRQVIRDPRHPYTRGLIDALPKLDDLDAPLTPVPGDIPSPLNRPSGCVFHTRCTMAQAGQCDQVTPQLQVSGDGHGVACHFADGVPATGGAA